MNTPMSICNSKKLQLFGRDKNKITGKQARGILNPNLRKALA